MWNEHRWDRPRAAIRDGRGPERVADDPDPEYVPRAFLGFARDRPTMPGVEPRDMPLLWEGDQA